ncbi:MAG: type II secretion system protein [Planctomycetota bacterium]|jgi:prepilin-type N-terminal cleavage/methylation domain-containing protein
MIRKAGFSLAEILIVVAILGILAAIIMPEMSGTSVEARTSALKSDLHRVRSQMELYKLHHDYQLPAVAGESSADFWRRMTTQTDVNGDPGFDFGPYLKGLPVNKFNNLATVRIDGAAAGANSDGWRFDTIAGDFQADDSPGHAML